MVSIRRVVSKWPFLSLELFVILRLAVGLFFLITVGYEMLTGFYFMFTRFNECIIYYGPTNLHLCTCSQESNCCELFSPSGTIHKHSFWSISHFRGSVSRTFHCSEENRMAEWWEEQKVEHILALYLCDSFDYRGIWNRSIETPLIKHWFLRPKEGSPSAVLQEK